MGVSQRDFISACCMSMGRELTVAGQWIGKATRKPIWANEPETPIIPADVQAKVFNYCEEVLAAAPEILNERDAGRLGFRNPALIRIRDAALYVLSITSGMRNEEAIGVESGSWRSEVRDGVQFHWVATTEHKTGKGKVEFLIPELTVKVLDLMNRYAKPLQEKMALEVAELRQSNTSGFDESDAAIAGKGKARCL